LSPLSSAISSLFQQFAACALFCGLALLDNTCDQLKVRLPQAVAVLAYHNEITLACNGYDVHPIGELHNKPLWYDSARRQLYFFAAYGAPRALNHIFACQDFERAMFGFFQID
jgi:hypothetical protein